MSLSTRFGPQKPSSIMGFRVELAPDHAADTVITVVFELGDGVNTVVAIDDDWLLDRLVIDLMEAKLKTTRHR